MSDDKKENAVGTVTVPRADILALATRDFVEDGEAWNARARLLEAAKKTENAVGNADVLTALKWYLTTRSPSAEWSRIKALVETFDSQYSSQTDAKDAARWRFRWSFLNDGGAFFYSHQRCMLYREGECIASGANELEAIDVALAKNVPAEGQIKEDPDADVQARR